MKVLLTEEQIKGITLNVANKLNELFLVPSNHPPILISILHGGMYFAADLSRLLTFDHYLETIEAKSYSGKKQGEVVLVKEPFMEIDGYDIILVDELIDSGKTIRKLKQLLKERYAVSSVTITALLAKQKHLLNMNEYECVVGEWIDNDSPFLYGYGLDADGLKRNIPYIYAE